MPVYFIQSDDGTVKIGWSLNPEQRLKTLSSSKGPKLKIVRIVEGTRATEKLFHRIFRINRLHGEWFKFSPQMLCVEAREENINSSVFQHPIRNGLPVNMTIREARLSLGIEQHELAKMMGVSAPFVSDLEKGNRPFHPRYLTKLPEPMRAPVRDALVELHEAHIQHLMKE